LIDSYALSSVAIPNLPEVRLPQEALSERLLTQLGTVFDATVLRAMQLVVDRMLVPKPEDLEQLRASAVALLDAELQRDPARFFCVDADDPVAREESQLIRRSLEGGIAVERTFLTDYAPYLSAAMLGSERDADADCIHVEHWMHTPGRPRASVVALHGFTMGQPRIDAVVLLASQWYRRGLDVVLLTLPYHGARSPSESRFSGEHFAVPHVARMAEAVRQAIYELRLVVRWLREQNDAPVGVLGLSLGGYLSALAATLYDDLDFVVPMVPPVCIGDLAWRFYSKSRNFDPAAEPAFSYGELRAAFRVHSPLAHPLRVPRERVLIVAGRGDRIVPPEHPNALWEHWGRPAIHWYSGSHLAPFRRGRIVEAIDAHLRRVGVL